MLWFYLVRTPGRTSRIFIGLYAGGARPEYTCQQIRGSARSWIASVDLPVVTQVVIHERV
jgi:hypothetical protein